MHSRALLVSAAVYVSAAARADEPPPPDAVAPLPPAPSTLNDKAAVMSGEWITSGRSQAPMFGLDLMLGQQTGVRPSLALYTAEHTSFVVEGYYGAMFTKFGAAETAGAGGRWMITRGGKESVTFGPGVDVLFHLNRGNAVVLAPTIDVALRRNFGERAAFVFGINAGVGIGLSGGQGNDRDNPVAGRVTPLISLYTGLRF